MGRLITEKMRRECTNAYHGTLLWQHQPQAFNSRSNLDSLNALPQSVFSHNVYGFTLREPLRRNKTFFFATFQQNTSHSTRNYGFVVPTADFGDQTQRIVSV